MNNSKIVECKNKLMREKELIELEIKKNNKLPDFGNNETDHFEGETDQTEAFTNQLAIVGDLKNRLDDVGVALGKIKTGNYGFCEKCKKEIGESILDIDPESRFCKDCKLSA